MICKNHIHMKKKKKIKSTYGILRGTESICFKICTKITRIGIILLQFYMKFYMIYFITVFMVVHWLMAQPELIMLWNLIKWLEIQV